MGDNNNSNDYNQQGNQNANQPGNQQQGYSQLGNQQPGNQQQSYQQPNNQQQPNVRQPMSQYQQTQYNGQPQYQYQQPYHQYQQPRGTNGMAVASMVCGIVSLCLSCCIWYISLPASIVGLVLGIISYKHNENGKGMAVAGIVTSAITIILAILVAVGCTAFYTGLINEINNSSFY